MGRHRSSLRDLGWGVSNSPNPWKQGSAKRVVRGIDFSNVQEDAPEPAAAGAQAWEGGQENEARVQYDSRQLGSIREQLAAEDTENRRKLDRLNGRIAELGDQRRGMWSVLGQQCKSILVPGPVGSEAAAPAAAVPAPAPAPAASEDAKKAAELKAAQQATAQQAEVEARARAAERAVAQREADAAKQEEQLAQKEAKLAEQAEKQKAAHAG
jgi:hypothetical protein